jgi:SAM-dependent methyltransferase
MNETTAQFLTSDAGRQLLERTTTLPDDTAGRVLRLRREGVSAESVSALIEVAAARKRARNRFPDADRLFFTDAALAQATSPILAAYHATYLAPFGTVADLGCGIGMDSIALAEAGASVLALERDPALLVFAQANAETRGVAARITFRQADVTTQYWTADAVYWDPARRTDAGGRVSRHADRYEPPLSFLEAFRGRVRGGGLKLSPALPDDILDSLNGRIEFLSEGRECKEACLWFGEARGAAGDSPRSAVLLPDRIVVSSAESPSVGPLGAYIFDPDPALIRADALSALTGAYRVSYDDSYLTGDILPKPPRLASAYHILDAMTYRPRDLLPVLKERGIGRLVVKKRHFPKEPDAVARELKLSGKGNEGTLILVRDGLRHLAVLCEPVL